MEQYIEDVQKYFQEAEVEFQKGHYHLVVGNLMYAAHILKSVGEEEHEIVGKIYHLLCKAHQKLKHIEKAYEIWDKAYAFYQDRDIYMLADLYNIKGILCSEEQKDRKAIQCYEETLRLLKDEDTPRQKVLVSLALFNLGNCHMRSGDRTISKEYYRKAFKCLNNTELKNLRGKILMGLGYLYHIENKIATAGRLYKLAQQCIDQDRDPIAYGRVLHNLGEVYLTKGDMEETRKLFEASISKGIVGDKLRVASSFTGIAYTYLDSDMAKLKTNSMEALNLAMNGIATRFSAAGERELGRVFLLFSHWLFHEGKIPDCKLYLKQAEAILRKYDMTMELNKLERLKLNHLLKEVNDS